MKECDILRGGVKTYCNPSYIVLGVETAQPQDVPLAPHSPSRMLHDSPPPVSVSAVVKVVL